MALQYDFFEVNELNNTKGKYRARAVSSGKVTTDKLAKWISQCSGVSAAEAKGFIDILTDSVIDFIVDGHEVEVGDLGYFSASVTSRLVDDPNEARSNSVCFNRLNFRAGVKVKKRIGNTEIERVKRPQGKKQFEQTTRQERAEELKKYLAGKPIITRSDYARLTGMQRKLTAIEDLNTFIREGWLERHGAGKTVVYMLKREG